MPKTTPIDMHALFDLVDAELRARRSPAALVSGLVPEDHSIPAAGGFEASSLPAPSVSATEAASPDVAPELSSSRGVLRCGTTGDLAPAAWRSRSRSPKSGTLADPAALASPGALRCGTSIDCAPAARLSRSSSPKSRILSEPAGGPIIAPSQLLEAFLNSQSTGGSAVYTEPPLVSGAADASSASSSPMVDDPGCLGFGVRPLGDGYELVVEDAFVSPGYSGPRSLVVPAFDGNRVLSGPVILRHCLLRHRAGRAWSAVQELCFALRRVAEVEQSRGPAGALALLRSGQ